MRSKPFRSCCAGCAGITSSKSGTGHAWAAARAFSGRRGTVRAGRGVQIGERCWLKVYGRGRPALLRLGDRVIINNNTTVEVTDRVEIGEGTLVSWNCNIMDSDFHRILDGDGAPLGPLSAPVIIGRHVWIGSGCTILKGVTIGDNAVIAAASVVVDDVPANVLVAGNPARVLRPISDWR